MESSAYHFDKQQAKDYLDNLAVAIQPYAATLQHKLQEENLKNAQEENKSLTDRSNQLQAKRKLLNYQISENERESKVAHLAKRKVRINRKINENFKRHKQFELQHQ
jgi:predicted RNase H-like nuclease (RuvC/YqgF family)